MDKVWIVTSGEYSDYHINAVFSTEYKATKYCEKWGGNIEIRNLDEPIPDVLWGIRMGIDGEVISSWKEPCRDATTEGFEFFALNNIAIVWNLKTEDKQRAIKVTNEKRIQILALGIWGDDEKVREMVK